MIVCKAIANTKTGKRRSEIIRQLSDLSRDGWSAARECDYKALERELAEIDAYIEDWRE